MPNTFSMAPRYVRDFAARTGFASPERDVFDGLERKLARLYREPPPGRRAGSRSLGDARDAGGRVRAALRARGLPDRARLVVTSPPYLRVVKYGYYNWLRTWLLGFDARAIDATLDDAHHREPYLAFLRDVLADLRTVAGRRRRRRPRHRRRRDRPRAADRGRRCRARRAGLGEAARAGGLPARRHRPRRGRGQPQDDQALGRRGRPGDEDGPDPRPRARPRRAGGGPSPPPRPRSTGTGRRAASAPSDRTGDRAMDLRPAIVPAIHTLLASGVGILAVIGMFGTGSAGEGTVLVGGPQFAFFVILPMIGIVMLGLYDWQVGRGSGDPPRGRRRGVRPRGARAVGRDDGRRALARGRRGGPRRVRSRVVPRDPRAAPRRLPPLTIDGPARRIGVARMRP